jgi:hypothetical protein
VTHDIETLQGALKQLTPIRECNSLDSVIVSDLQREVSALKTQIARLPGILDSRIISDFPEIFAEFHKFSLLWRGSRDGFKAQKFHR